MAITITPQDRTEVANLVAALGAYDAAAYLRELARTRAAWSAPSGAVASLYAMAQIALDS